MKFFRINLVLGLFAFCTIASGQSNQTSLLDSLKTEINALGANNQLADHNKLYTQIGRAYEKIHNDSALSWYKKQLQFLKNTALKSAKKDSLIGSVYLDISYIYSIAYSTKEEVQKVLDYTDSAYTRFTNSGEFEMAIRARNNKGLALLNQNRFEEGIEVLIQAMDMTQKLTVEKKKNYTLQNLYINIGKGYIGLKQWPQAISNTRKSLQAFNVPRLKMIAYLNLSAIYLDTKVADSVLFYANKCYSIADSLNDDYTKLLANVNTAEAYTLLKDYDKALPQIEDNIAISRQFEYPYGIATGLNQKAIILSKQGKNKEALAALKQAEILAQEVSEAELLIDNFENLAEVYFRMGNYGEAYNYQKRFITLRDSINNVENTTNYNNLLLRYESSEKERKIAEQDLEIQIKEASITTQKNRVWITVILSFVLLLIGLLAFFRYRQLQERKHKNAIITEQEKGLAAIITATEDERKRISKDLHDGIGQKLTALRLGLINLKPKVTDNTAQKELSEISDEFTKSAEEVRSISHQMMPRVLLDEGLVKAIEDLLQSTFKFTDTQYNFDYHNVDKRYAEKIEISVYRITQELINNSLKHSNATEVQVQLMELNKKLVLIVEDNGIGMQSAKPTGHGLKNIKSRLDFINGAVNYEPGPQTGTLATITIPV